MPEIVATNGSASANSLVTLDEALAYFADRPFSDDFLNESEDQQKKLLIAAAKQMKSWLWLGEKTTTTQGMFFPRVYCPNPDEIAGAMGRRYPFNSDVIPQQAKDAQCELAEWLRAQGADAFLGAGGEEIQSFKLGDLIVARNQQFQASSVPPRIVELVREMVAVGGRSR